MSSILQELEKQIGGLKTSTSKSNVGIVREVGDGVAKIEGLTDAMLNEMIDFGNGDQLLLQNVAGLQGTPIPSLQSTAYRPSSVGLPSFKVMSYSGANGALFPESRPDQLFNRTFGSSMPALSADQIAKIKAQKGSVLDFVNKDITRLRGFVPKSQLPKLDAHLDGHVTIPMAGPAESLNVAMAATVLCFESARQRGAGSGR